MNTRLLPSLILRLGAAACLALSSYSRAADTRLLPFQGRLSDANGNAIPDGAKVVQFKIYDAPVGGRAVWNGEVQKLTVNGGLVSTLLGTKADLSNVDFDLDLYLELTIDANEDGQIGPADPPLLPRQSILPAVFANESADSRLLDGYDWSALFGTSNPADGTLLDSKIRDNSLTSGKIADNAVTSAKIANGAVARSKLDVTGATAGQTLQFNGTQTIWGHFSSLNAADGSPGNALIVDNAGNVGIGTPNPQGASLAINGGVRARGGPPGGLGVNNNGYAFSGGGGDNDSGMFSSGDGQVQFFTDSVERVRIHDFGAAIFGNATLEFGAGVAGKEPNAGKIGYTTFSGDALDIVGAGPWPTRRVNLYIEGGMRVFGGVGMFDNDIRFRALDDGNHFLGWRNAMGNQSNFDGPALVGNAGGVLGTDGGANWSLRWFSNGNVRSRGSIASASDRNLKENFAPVDKKALLENVLALPITRWNYKAEPDAHHIGPVAQDFSAAFGLGDDDHYIATVDSEGVALAAIQALNQKLEEKENEIRQLVITQQQQIEALKAEFAALKAEQH